MTKTLRRRGCALRIRNDSGRSLLTFKGPVQPGPMKMREEHETVLSDGDVLTYVLESLGLHVWFRYQKFREEFAAEDATIALDETPIGTFIEIEGGERAILSLTCALGRTPGRVHPRLVPQPVPGAARTLRAERRQYDVRRRMVPALVLTAGLATRLRPLSLVRAKAALPVAGVSLVHRILRSLAVSGVTDAVLNLHHLPHTLTNSVGDGSALGMRVRYSWEVPCTRAGRRSAPCGSPPRLHVPHRQRGYVDRPGRSRAGRRPSALRRPGHDGRRAEHATRQVQWPQRGTRWRVDRLCEARLTRERLPLHRRSGGRGQGFRVGA
jgi:hypothetical protein